ncbi:MAG TPA: MFS transporter [Candidatus Acidoferrum sp.]|nr:MFS transporter [Candidatus Acidoferrum sp.]
MASLWRHREFLKFWAGSAISDVGSQVTALAVPLIAALTLDATPWQMGLLSAAGGAPILLVGLFAGVWVDRVRRRPVMIATDLGRAVLLLIIPLAAVTGVLRIEILYAVLLLTGALTVLFDVANMSLLPSLVVTPDRIVEGNTKLQSTAAAAQVVGPSVGGVLVSLFTAPFALLVDALSFLISAAFIARTNVPEAAPDTRGASAGVVSEIAEGVRVVVDDRVLRALAGASATTILFGRMFMAVYVLYMTRVLGWTAVGVGLVFATGGVGSLAGSVVAEPLARRFGPGPTMIGAQVAFGLIGMMVPLAVLVPSWALPMIVASEFGQWMAILVYFVVAISVRQAITPDRVLGRVNATMRFLAGGANPIGAVIGGALGALIGVPLTLVVASFGMLLGFLWLLLSPVRELFVMPATNPSGPSSTAVPAATVC